MAQEVIIYLSLILVIAAITAIIARMIKQPAIIAYLIAGVLAGPLFFGIINPSNGSSEFIQILAHIGIAFLLFIVGLSLDLRLLKEVGGVSLFGGIAGMLVTGGLGYLISIALGLNSLTGLYMGAVLAFSSTIVVVKILSDKKEIDTLHGRIALGILIVQDFAAAIVLMIVPLLTQGGEIISLFTRFFVAIFFIGIILLTSQLILNRFMNYLAQNQETLFLFGIAWALILSTAFIKMGFSLEIGALVAGISLASSKYTLELGGKIKPLRDFFIVLFFVFFGSQLVGNISFHLLKMALVFSIFILIGKPLISMATLRFFGYKKRTNFLTGISLAQISEFSLILTLLGYTLGHLTNEIISLSILIAIFTIVISSYSIYYSNSIFYKVSSKLNIFDGKGKGLIENRKIGHYDVILFGYHRIGYKILQSLRKMNISFAVIDYNPKVVLSLGEIGLNTIYGDASDKEFLNELDLKNTKLIISTIPDEMTNLTIKEFLKSIKSNVAFIATAEQPRVAANLYKRGIDYVIIPHHLGGNYIAHMIESYHTNKSKYKDAGKNHVRELRKAKRNSVFSGE